MRLATRMKVTYIIVFFVPIILLTLTSFCLGSLELKELEERYGMENTNVTMLFDPFQMLEQMSGELNRQLEKTVAYEPEKMEDISYLDEMNQAFQKNSAELVVLKNGELYYSGAKGLSGHVYGESEAASYVTGEEPFYLKQFPFRFQDGSQGVARVLTPVDEVMEQVRSTVAKIFISGVVVLLLVVALAFVWLYQSIV